MPGRSGDAEHFRIGHNLGVRSEEPVIVAYRRDWPQRAGELSSTLELRLAGLVDHIEHIGSTSIPGMAAKNVLDLQASVPSLSPPIAHSILFSVHSASSALFTNRTMSRPDRTTILTSGPSACGRDATTPKVM